MDEDLDKEEVQFREKFKKYPSSFNLDIKDLNKSKNVKIYKGRLERKYESGEFESTAEQPRLLNLLSFLCWNAGVKEIAHGQSRKCIELEKENIVALCNRVWMTRKDGHLTEADEELNEVEEIVKARPDLLLRGKGEIAYSYSVFGPEYFLKSMKLYEELLESITDICIESNLVQLWKMDLGILYRKFCNVGNTIATKQWEQKDKDTCMKNAAALLYEVASSDSPARWRGRCYAALGEFSYSTSTGTVLKKGKEDLFPFEIKDKDTESLLNLALQICDEDSGILNICGKTFKYLKKLDKAEEVLMKSLEKRETALAHYHLALVLKNRLKERYFEARGYHPEKEVSNTSQNAEVSHEPLKSREQVQSNEYNPDIVYERCRQNQVHAGSDRLRNRDKNYSGEVNTSCSRSHHHGRSHRGRGIREADHTSIIKEANSYHELSITNLNENFELMAVGNDECEKHVFEHVGFPVNERHPDPSTSEQYLKRAITKGYKHVWIIPNSEDIVVERIFDHLNKAIKDGNAWASLEKGIVLRQIQKPKEAIEAFLATLEMEGFKTSIIDISCYEHLGASYNEMAEREINSEQKRKFSTNAVKYLLKAIEKLATKAHALHFLKDGWMALPMLNDIFNPKQSDDAMPKELKELSKMLEQYDGLSGLRDMIMKPEEEIHENIKTLLKQKEFEKAAALLAVQNCAQSTRIDKRLRKLVYLEYAFNLTEMKEASQRLKQAFAVDCSDNSEVKFEIFFLYDEEAENTTDGELTPASFISKTVEKFVVCESGLRFTKNSDNVTPGTRTGPEQAKLMKSTMHIVLILDANEEPSEDLLYFIEIAKQIYIDKTSKLSLILVDDTPCPPDLKPFPQIHFERKLMQCQNHWARKFFYTLLDVNDTEDNVYVN
ncbi:hypothetical protein ACJMK2_027659 [Sinanodonta woodiana]|uniref:Uncharacterized protein n=1 Tax=Sinanodonta woodiana TaxID=1069815 RepID=A0ABD3X8L6_SINWO